MKKTITVLSLIGSLLIIVDSLNIAHWFILFILTGVVPGTDIRISPIDMLAAHATAITVVILRITTWPSIRTVFFPHVKTHVSKKHVSRRAAH